MKFLTLILLSLSISLLSFAKVLNVEEMKEGDRKFRSFKLENGISVLVISDAKATKAAAALSVGTGQMYDPKDKQGLAHFVEHMLFIKNKKYPEVNSFDLFLQKNGGSSNAYTEVTETNFYFEIDGKFNEALERFSELFISPIFDQEFVAKEKQAVNNEYTSVSESDGRLFWHMLTMMLPPNAPQRTMGWGNLESLKTTTAADAEAFYKKYYLGKNMTLSLVSNESLDKLQGQAEKIFSQIKAGTSKLVHPTKFYETPHARDIKILALENTDELSILFEVPGSERRRHTQVGEIIKSLINYQGPNSFASELLNQGLVNWMSAMNSTVLNGQRIGINCSLTEKGRNSIPLITKMFFSYLTKIKNEGYRKYLFEEVQNLGRISYKFRTKSKNSNLVSSFTSLMHSYHPFKTKQLSIIQEYSVADFKQVMSFMVPSNMDRILQAPYVVTNKTTPEFNVKYAIDPIAQIELTELGNINDYDFSYPPKNNFVVTQAQLNRKYPTSSKRLTKIKMGKIGELWVHNDARFPTPKASVELMLYLENFTATAENYAHARLYDWIIYESMRQWRYPISKSGVSVEVSSYPYGIYIKVSGLSPNIPKVVDEIASHLKNIKISDKLFETTRASLKKSIDDRKFDKPSTIANRGFSEIDSSHFVSHHEYVKYIDKISLSDLKEFSRRAFDKVRIQGVAAGAIKKSVILKSVRGLFHDLGAKPVLSKNLSKPKDLTLPNGKYAFQGTSQKKAAYWSTRYQLNNENPASAIAALGIFEKLYSSSFFTELRTQQQLGYSVSLYSGSYSPTLSMTIESDSYGPDVLETRAMNWLSDVRKKILNVSDEELAVAKKTIIKSYLTPPDSIFSVASTLRYQLNSLDGDTKFISRIIFALKRMNKKQFLKTLDSALDNGTQLTAYMTKKGAEKIKIPGQHVEVEPRLFRLQILDAMESGIEEKKKE